MLLYFLLILGITFANSFNHDQMNVSNRGLRRILVSETNTAKVFKVKLNEELSSLQNFISLFMKLSSQSAQSSREDYVSTPVPALMLTRRLVEDWTALAGMARRDYRLHLVTGRWPTPHHVALAAYTVMRSQWTYGLDTGALADGVSSWDNMSYNMTASDCYHVGDAYFTNKLPEEAAEWFLKALHKTTTWDSVLWHSAAHRWIIANCYSGNSVKKSLLQSGDSLRNLLYGRLSTTGSNILQSYKEVAQLKCDRLQHKISNESLFDGISRESTETHRLLCRGSEPPGGKLRCRYLHHNLPHLRIQPFKTEELHLDPLVMRYYDVITDSESEEIRELALDEMELAGDIRDGVTNYDNFRTSHVAWLYCWAAKSHLRLCRRMEDMTRLRLWPTEPSQVSRYCVSGEYLSHHDYFPDESMVHFTWNRMATLMFYLNEVKGGGNTVFPLLNLSVRPIKNSAILWFNFLPSGEADPRTLHAGCPVLRGTKWDAKHNSSSK